jgi:hypothetical protein
MAERCVCCGEIIPEGRQVCPNCEHHIADVRKKDELEPCPVCGAKAYISSAAPDGFFMGWSVGCPRYCVGDGIHGIDTFEEDEKRALALHGFFTREEAIEARNRRADNDRKTG